MLCNATSRRALVLAAGALLIGFAFAAPAAAQKPVLFSPDITARLGPVLPAVVADDDSASDDAAGSVMSSLLVAWAAIPANAAIAAFDLGPTLGPVLSLDTTSPLPGLPVAAPAEPRDVVRFDPATLTFAIVFDGAVSGVPSGVGIDAIALDAAESLLLSFDTSVTLPGVGPVADEDLVRFAGGVYAMFYDGSAQGIPPELDLDAANLDVLSGLLLLSFDTTGAIPGLTFDDEDVVSFDTLALSYAMYFDASLSDPVAWPDVDLAAVPEPGLSASFVAGGMALTLLARRRYRLRR
jgi:hypothetical protein